MGGTFQLESFIANTRNRPVLSQRARRVHAAAAVIDSATVDNDARGAIEEGRLVATDASTRTHARANIQAK